jgi:hypothetical protein
LLTLKNYYQFLGAMWYCGYVFKQFVVF